MRAGPCEDRGADLFAAAGEHSVPPGVEAHLRTCEGCAAEVEALRPLATAARHAPLGPGPGPGVRAALLAALGPQDRAAAVAPPRRRRGARILVLAGLVTASAAAGILMALRPPEGAAPPGVSTGASGLLVWSGPPAGHLAAVATLPPERTFVAAGRTAFRFRFGDGTEVDVVAADGVRIALAGAHRADARTFVLDGAPGPAWFRTPGASAAVEVRRGDVSVSGGGAFTLLPLETGVGVLVSGGTVRVTAGGASTPVTGPARVDVPRGGAPGTPVPGEGPDARAWFHHPEVVLEPVEGPDGPEWRIVLTPSLPEPLPIAIWDHFDPLFFVSVTAEDGAVRNIPLRRNTLAGPAPEGAPGGPFLLGPDHPYILRVNPGSLGLGAGRHRVAAVYVAARPGGTWRGTARSPEWTYESR